VQAKGNRVKEVIFLLQLLLLIILF